jgi:hypothetical protein
MESKRNENNWLERPSGIKVRAFALEDRYAERVVRGKGL